MHIRPRFLTLTLVGLLAASSTAVRGQILTDSNFAAADYDTFVAGVDGLEDVRFSFDYGNFDIFGDGFITGSIPEAPNSSGGTATTGAFLSVNNDGTATGAGTEPLYAAIFPKNLNVGTGTANPNYRVKLDVFASTGTGVLDTVDGVLGNEDDVINQSGTTNKIHVGINHANSADVAFNGVSIDLTGGGAANGTAPSGTQGLGLSISPDTGASEDYIPIYGGEQYALRTGRPRSVLGGTATTTGRTADFIQEFWRDAGLGLEINDYPGRAAPDNVPTATELSVFTGDPQGHFAPDPADPASFDGTNAATGINFYTTTFGVNSDPLHYDVSEADLQAALGVAANSRLATNDELGSSGTPYNQWTEHEILYSDEIMTYSIDGTIILQMAVADASNAVSAAGTVLLGYYDRFSSVATSPEGANFVIYDNLEVTAAASGETPDLEAHLAGLGFLPSSTTPGDADGDGDVDGTDFLILQRDNPAGIADWEANFPSPVSGVTTVPEPSTAVLFLGLSFAMFSRRKRN